MEKKKGLSLQTILTIAGLALVYLLAFLLAHLREAQFQITGNNFCPTFHQT